MTFKYLDSLIDGNGKLLCFVLKKKALSLFMKDDEYYYCFNFEYNSSYHSTSFSLVSEERDTCFKWADKLNLNDSVLVPINDPTLKRVSFGQVAYNGCLLNNTITHIGYFTNLFAITHNNFFFSDDFNYDDWYTVATKYDTSLKDVLIKNKELNKVFKMLDEFETQINLQDK